MTNVEFLLSERNNPHSAVRANGTRWWGHPSRQGGTSAITAIAIHTTENNPSPASALNVARWQAFTAPAPSSYHVLVDSDHTVRTVLDSQVAFHVGAFNTPSLGLSFATRAGWWGRYPDWDRQALARGAVQARVWCELYGIPLRWLTREQALAGQRGFVRHSVMDPSRRSDPGSGFPATAFFDLIAPTPSPAPDPAPDPEPTTTWLEDIMATGERQLADIATALDRHARAQEQTAAAQRALAAVEGARFAARVRDHAGRDPDPVSDGIHGDRIGGGERTLRQVAEQIVG